MGIRAKIIADSIGPANIRLTTWELTYHRMFHAEVMTYCMWSRNAASSRAIPIAKMRERIKKDPAMPVYWGANQKGMEAQTSLVGWRKRAAVLVWLLGCRAALAISWLLMKIGVHKQIANRVTEPWMYITTIVTADQYALANMWHQRDHHAAQPEFRRLARLMWAAYNLNKPRALGPNEWHLPFITFDDEVDAQEIAVAEGAHVQKNLVGRTDEILRQVSVGRVARTSYLNHNGVRDLKEDMALHDRLLTAKPGHMSPFEHIARALTVPATQAKLHGWTPYRMMLPNENLCELPIWKPMDYLDEIKEVLSVQDLH
jgi:hypothetical protein